MKRILLNRMLSVFALWSLSVFALADNAPSFPNAAQSATDMSVKYLGQIFGAVPGVLTGSGSGLMGKLFLVFNQGIMVVAFVYLLFNIAQVIMHHGMEAQASSKYSFAKIFFRIAIGLALLVPSSTTGYSAIQDLMMKVVVEGTKLADLTWNQALDYMQGGGMIYSPPTGTNQLTNMQDITDSNYIQIARLGSSSNPRQGLVNTLFKDEVCMYLSTDYNKKNKSTDQVITQGAKGAYSMIPVQPKMAANGTSLVAGTGAVYFPGYGDATNYTSNIDTPAQTAHSCGSISIDSATLASAGANQLQYQQAFSAAYQMALDIQPLAKAQANRINSGNVSSGLSAASGGKWLAQSILEYINLMKPVASFQATSGSSKKGEFFTEAKAEGWFNAGGFYWDLSRWNDSLANSTGEPAKLIPLIPKVTYPSEINDKITSADNTLGGNGSSDIWGSGYRQIEKSIVQTNSGNASGQGIGHKINRANSQSHHFVYDTGGIDFASIIQDSLRGVMSAAMGASVSKSAYDPLVMVQNVGKSCLSAAGNIWKKSISWAVGLSAVMGVCDSANPGGAIMNSMMSWMMPMWTAVSGGLFAAGFLLTFYAPLYPYLLFLFGVIGWLLAVIEAMIAAPLVCFGMTHPEGHDFMGRAEQALMLALSVFLRPALMVIGFLAGMLLTYVGFAFVNTVLGRVLVTAFGNPDAVTQTSGATYSPISGVWTVIAGSPGAHGQNDHFTGHDFSDFLLIPLLLVAYGMIVIEVVNQCFSAIHVVPDQVLRWIGGPVQQDTSEQHAGAVKGAMQGAAQKAGELGASGSQGMGKTGGAGAKAGVAGGKAGAGAGIKALNSGGDVGGAGGAGEE
ncbi:MAG: DotA/TraY family protein [Coxiellaceae bacterium]|nr:DotA/TraY family protein [Coxiellaceae bacterium]